MTTRNGISHTPLRRRPFEAWTVDTVVVAFTLAAGALVLNPWWVRPRAALVKAIFEQGPAVTPGPAYDAAAASVDVIPNVVVGAPAVPPAALDLYHPKRPQDSPLPLILWIHGGGFLSGSKTQVGPYATMLAAEGYVVASLDYALAPRHRYPTAILQANAAAAHLARHAADYRTDPTRFFFGGDSAGAQLASQLAALQTQPTLAAALSLARLGLPASPARGDLVLRFLRHADRR